eukprot:365086-Chlamydomonas_euryale.AAC.18
MRHAPALGMAGTIGMAGTVRIAGTVGIANTVGPGLCPARASASPVTVAVSHAAAAAANTGIPEVWPPPRRREAADAGVAAAARGIGADAREPSLAARHRHVTVAQLPLPVLFRTRPLMRLLLPALPSLPPLTTRRCISPLLLPLVILAAVGVRIHALRGAATAIAAAAAATAAASAARLPRGHHQVL